MNKELKELLDKRNDLNKQIESFKDGYIYIIKVMIYKHLRTFKYFNESTFLDTFYEYESGDNGIIESIECNNPEIIECDNISFYINN